MRSIQASLQLTLSKPEPCQDRVCQAHGLPAPWAVGTRQSPPRQQPNAARAGEWGLDHQGGKHPCLVRGTGVHVFCKEGPPQPLP